jgi:hypothetical protein
MLVCDACVYAPVLVDRATSGLLVFALTKPLQRWLAIAFEKRRVFKKYEALVVPTPGMPEPSGTGVVASSVCRRPDHMWCVEAVQCMRSTRPPHPLRHTPRPRARQSERSRCVDNPRASFFSYACEERGHVLA